MPSIVFVTKMDRERADFDMALNGLTSALGMKPVVFYMPILEGEKFVGLVDVFAAKALMFGEDGATTDAFPLNWPMKPSCCVILPWKTSRNLMKS